MDVLMTNKTKKEKPQKIAIFGAGSSGKDCYNELIGQEIKVSFFIDNNPPSSGEFFGVPVYEPQKFVMDLAQSVDAIVLASGRSQEMRRQLMSLNVKKPLIEYVAQSNSRALEDFYRPVPKLSLVTFEKKCFAKCRFCYQVQNPEAVIEEEMDMGLFKKIINDIPEDAETEVVIAPGGETLTDSRLFEQLQYIATTRPKVKTSFATNGVLLSDEAINKLISSGLGEIMISLNALNREDYQWFMGIDAFDRVAGNIKRFMEIKKELGSPYPVVKTKIVSLKRFADSIDSFICYWRDIVDEAEVSPVAFCSAQDPELENIPSYNPPSYPSVPTCVYIFGNIVIMPNGRFQLCCNPDFGDIKYGGIELGNAAEESFMNVWTSPIYRLIRERNLNGKPVMKYCLGCDVMRHSVEWDKQLKDYLITKLDEK